MAIVVISNACRWGQELATALAQSGQCADVCALDAFGDPTAWPPQQRAEDTHQRLVLDCRSRLGFRLSPHSGLRLRVHVAVVDAGNVRDAVLATRAGVPHVVEECATAAATAARVAVELAHTPAATNSCGDVTARILGNNPAIQMARDHVRRVAQFPDLGVLIAGETGTGKELVAEAIHELGHRGGEFVAINCAAVPGELFEAEFFGHEAGAFTGARGRRAGLVEKAARGTLFLDEVGELDHQAQAKLLRLLEARQYRRVAATQLCSFDGRIVAATHRRAADMVMADTPSLRSDVYFRLAAFVINMPPLRERPEDIPLLAEHFLEQFRRRYGRAQQCLTPSAVHALQSHDWPGNVRELRSVVERSAVVSEVAIDADDLVLGRKPASTAGARVASAPELRKVERELILSAYEAASRNITLAAERLGMPRTTLRDKLKRYATEL